MHDPMIEKLSAYIDDDLSPAERSELEAHLAECDVCSSTLDELRDVVVAAAAVRPTGPAADLWPGIAERIGSAAAPQPDRGSVAGTIVPRRFSVSLPQLAAAAVVLMTLSGGAVWLAGNTGAARTGAGDVATADDAASMGAIVYTAGGDAPNGSTSLIDSDVPDVAGQDAYESDVTELERALDDNRGSLDPATVEVIERSLESIDAAISDAREALASDPGNPHLHRQLDSTMRKKLDVLRRATRGAS